MPTVVATGSHWRAVRYPPGQEPPSPTPEEQGLVCPPADPFATYARHNAVQEQGGEQEKPGLMGRLRATARAGVSWVGVGSGKKSDAEADEITPAEAMGFERLPASQRPWDKSVKSVKPYEGT